MARASGSFSSAAIQVDIARVSGDHGHACIACGTAACTHAQRIGIDGH